MTMSRTFLILGALLIILGGIALYASHRTSQAPSAPAVTETVSTTVDPNWLTYSDEFLSFRYPAALSTTYIHSVDWPPKMSVSSDTSTCVEIRIINGHSYCVTATSEGAAGSTYVDYTYAFEKEGKNVTLAFTIRQVQCANYDDSEEAMCERERNTFDIDTLADSIAQTIIFE